MIDYLLLVPVGYLLGSVPFGLIAVRVFRGVDVRDYGSGGTGMTNVLRTVSLRVAIPVLILDMGKSVLAVVLARVFSGSYGVEVAVALAAIVGHSWPVFIGFKGGRGTSPGWGGLFILSPPAALIASVIGLSTVAIFRYVSLGSILGAGSGAIALLLLAILGFEPAEYAWYAVIGVPLIFARHKDNIKRLMRGEERKLGHGSGVTRSNENTRRDKGTRWPRSV